MGERKAIPPEQQLRITWRQRFKKRLVDVSDQDLDFLVDAMCSYLEHKDQPATQELQSGRTIVSAAFQVAEYQRKFLVKQLTKFIKVDPNAKPDETSNAVMKLISDHGGK